MTRHGLFCIAMSTLALLANAMDAERLAETKRIQGLIDQVAAQGGGRVTVTEGVHPCGTLYLKSNVELHLEKGAVLLGGDNSSCYDDAIPDNAVYSYAGSVTNTSTRKAFIFAEGATNIAVTGKGVIDSQGPKFFDQNTVLWGCFWAKPNCHRPRMVVFQDCRGIRLEDATFKDSPVWTIWLRRCADITVSRIRIVAEPKMINSDGIDFDGCRNVRMGDSLVSTGDDCLVLRSIRRGAPAGTSVICENVVVSNCVLSTPCQGVRIGCPSDDTIRNAVFRDIVFTGNNAIFANQEPQYLESGNRGRLSTRNILFENWDIRCQGCPISVVVQKGVTLKDFGHMTFRNIRIDSSNPVRICGNDSTRVKRMTLDGIFGTLRTEPQIETNKATDLESRRVLLPSRKVPFQLGIARYTMHQRGHDKALEILRSIDCHNLGLIEGSLPHSATPDQIVAFKMNAAKYGVSVVTAGPLYYSTAKEVRALFSFAKEMGFRTVSVVPFEVKKIDGKEVRMESDAMLDVLESCVREYDIRAAIHNHGPDIPHLYPTAEAVWKRIEKRDPRIGFCLDVGHQRRAGGDPVAAIEKYANRIYEIHLKNITVDPVKNLAESGPRGELDVPGILLALARVGFDGYCMVEYEKDFASNEMPLAESIGYYRGIMDTIGKMSQEFLKKGCPCGK